MNTIAQRAFAVFWWLLVIATIGWCGFWIWILWSHYPSDVAGENFWSDYFTPVLVFYLIPGLLPFIAITLIRWIVSSRWRFGPL